MGKTLMLSEVRLGVRMAKEGRGTYRTGRRHDERA